MNKQEFITRLQCGLSCLPTEDVNGYLTFYSEMIDERIEDGLSEEEATSQIGDIDVLISKIVTEYSNNETPPTETKTKTKSKTWEFKFMVIGSPLWTSLCIVAFAIIVCLYISLWAVVVSLWAIFVSVVAGALGGIATGIIFAFRASSFFGLTMLSAGLFFAGLSILALYVAIYSTKLTVVITKKLASRFKHYFIKKEEAQ